MIAFCSSAPLSVREYSTLGGISANARRATTPDWASLRRIHERVAGETPLSSLTRSVKRTGPWLPIAFTAKRTHFFPRRLIVPFSAHTQ